jgi:branched-chain amino acid transport system permease protein
MSVLIYGLISSVTLALMAIGLSFTFGVSGIANFAYSAFYIFSAYLTWQLLNAIGIPYFLAIVISIFATALLGAIIYWAVLLRLRGQILSEVIATFALGVGILELLRWSGLTGYGFKLPRFVEGYIEIMGEVIDYQRLIVVIIGIGLVIFIYIFTRFTKVGRSFRAIAQNERTALSFGIESDWTAMLSLAFGSALGGVAAVTLMPLSIIMVEEGSNVLIFALAVGIIGGLESILGIIVGSFILGYAQVITATYISPHLIMVVALGAIITILLIKPSGLFGKYKELEERV